MFYHIFIINSQKAGIIEALWILFNLLFTPIILNALKIYSLTKKMTYKSTIRGHKESKKQREQMSTKCQQKHQALQIPFHIAEI